MAKISDSIKGFDKLKTRREKFNAVMNHENGGHSKSKALHKARGMGGEMSAKGANEKAITWQKKTGRDYHTGRKLN